MGITSFLATVANNFRQHYLDLAAMSREDRTPDYFTSSRLTSPEVPIAEPTQVEDSYQPSVPVDPKTETVAPPASTEGDDASESNSAAAEAPVERQPDGTYYYQRRAQLDYKLDLRFDLGAITSTIERIADGETVALEEMAAAGFGFKAGFDLKGSQSVKTNMDVEGSSGHRKTMSLANYRNAGKLAFGSRNFAMNSFYKEATGIRRSLDESVQGNHRRTVNRIALRFRLDNRFSMSFANRFNVQTRAIADNMPQAVGGYVDSAGEIAAKGSTEMMATFFDAVDGYLDQTEQNLVAKISGFFDQAAADLGFSGELLDQAKEHLVGTIESFFDRVDLAMNQLEAKFVPEPPPAIIAPPPIAEIPEAELIDIPAPLPVDLYAPAAVEDRYELATG